MGCQMANKRSKVAGRETMTARRKLEANIRERLMVEASRSGLTKEQAAVRAGVKPDTMCQYLYNRFGDRSWPIKEQTND